MPEKHCMVCWWFICLSVCLFVYTITQKWMILNVQTRYREFFFFSSSFFFLRMWLRSIVGQPGNSSSSSRVKLEQTTVQLCKRAGFDDVGHRLDLTTGAQISVCKTPCLSTGTAMPLTGTKRFRRDHCCHGSVKPGCRIVGSSTKWALTTGIGNDHSLQILGSEVKVRVWVAKHIEGEWVVGTS